MADREQQIRDRAYSIWEEQGRPQGEDMRHWLQAWQELSDGDIPDEDANAMTLPDNVADAVAESEAGKVSPLKASASPKGGRKKRG